MWMAILSFLGGPVIKGLIDAYNARLKAGNVDNKIAADLAADEVAAQVSETNAILKYRIAEIGHWYEPDKLMGYFVALYFGKLLVWDKVLGLGTTDPLAGFAAVTSNLVVSFYFAKRGFENVAFFDSASIPKFDQGQWWLAYHETVAVAFAGIVSSTHACNAGYFCRVGVLRRHCGNALQLRLMRALESRARHNGWTSIVSDTTDNLASANNFIRAGYRLYQPQYPWGWPNTLYWRKPLR